MLCCAGYSLLYIRNEFGDRDIENDFFEESSPIVSFTGIVFYFIPCFFVAGVIMLHLGVDLILGSLVTSRKVLDSLEYLCVIFVAAVVSTMGFVEGRSQVVAYGWLAIGLLYMLFYSVTYVPFNNCNYIKTQGRVLLYLFVS